VTINIPLPEISRTSHSQAHPFPLQIVLQAQEFIQGAIFLAAFGDIAAGEFVRTPGGVDRTEVVMRERGLAQGVSDEAWRLVRKYKAIFELTVFQSVLFSLNSHWDWYVRRLSEFIRFSRRSVGGSGLSAADEKRLARADHLPLGEQIEVLELGAGAKFALTETERDDLIEMSLVRNLGLHNRWEADDRYLKSTKKTEFSLGQLRLVSVEELFRWHSLLIKALRVTGSQCAKAFVGAPDFPV